MGPSRQVVLQHEASTKLRRTSALPPSQSGALPLRYTQNRVARQVTHPAMSSFTLIVKPTAGGDKFSVEASLSMTIAELKQQVQAKSQMLPEEQRLIYKGQVLKDERTAESYGTDCRSRLSDRIVDDKKLISTLLAGLKNEHVLHMVRKASQSAPATQTSTATAGPGGNQPSAGADQPLPDLSSLVCPVCFQLD